MIENETSLSYWINSIWTTYHIMLSTGYGNSFPETYFIKIQNFFIGIGGYVIFSMTVGVFNDFLDLQDRNMITFLELEKERHKKFYMNKAAKVIGLLMRSFQ